MRLQRTLTSVLVPALFALGACVPAGGETLQPDGSRLVFRVGMSYAEMETRMLLQTLEHYSGDKRAAAAALGVSTRTIHNQLARLKHVGRPDRGAGSSHG